MERGSWNHPGALIHGIFFAALLSSHAKNAKGMVIKMQKYLLGIDLGNTKTEYLLCTAEGDFVDIYNVGSPSRKTYEVLIKGVKEQLDVMLKRNGISGDGIEALGIGLAMSYKPKDKEELESLIKKIIGVNKLDISTDTGHGTYAYWLGRGVGIYSFVSTGDITMGLSNENKWVTVGGIKLNVGVEACGDVLYKKALSMMYDYYCRCGKNSVAFPSILSLTGLDENDFHKSMKAGMGTYKSKGKAINMLMDDAAQAGDEVARALFEDAGVIAGRNAAGCIREMTFKEDAARNKPVPIVLIGSIWNRLIYNGMRRAFMKTVQELSGRTCRFKMPEAPPVAGSVFKAAELFTGRSVSGDFRTKVLNETALKSTEKEMAGFSKDGLENAELLRFLVTVKHNRPNVAEKLDIEGRMLEAVSGYSELSGFDSDSICKYLPVITSVMSDNSARAFRYFISAYQAGSVPKGDLQKLISLFPPDTNLNSLENWL